MRTGACGGSATLQARADPRIEIPVQERYAEFIQHAPIIDAPRLAQKGP